MINTAVYLSAWNYKGLDRDEPTLDQLWQDKVALGFWSSESGDLSSFTLDRVALSRIKVECNVGILLDSQLLLNEYLADLVTLVISQFELLQCALQRVEDHLEVTSDPECSSMHRSGSSLVCPCCTSVV